MLFDTVLIIVMIILRVVRALLSTIAFVIPDYWETAINHFISYGGYFQGWLPMYPNPAGGELWSLVGIMPLIGFYIQLLAVVYTLTLIVMLVRMIPFGGTINIPFLKGRDEQK